MRRKFAVSLLVLLAIACSFIYAQNDIKKAVKPPKKSVLILKDTSSLETAVSRIISDTLTKLGCKVKVAELANINKKYASLYKVSIIFSAINAGNEVDPRIQNFIASKVDTSSKVFVYSVYGSIYSKQGEKVDATTEATKALHPGLIADQILRSLKPYLFHPR
jgi:ABC-type proline/glycine betaine transport system substrate-binding protein